MIAAHPRTGRLQRQVRRCFMASVQLCVPATFTVGAGLDSHRSGSHQAIAAAPRSAGS